jgi:hypothetical protein
MPAANMRFCASGAECLNHQPCAGIISSSSLTNIIEQ